MLVCSFQKCQLYEWQRKVEEIFQFKRDYNEWQLNVVKGKTIILKNIIGASNILKIRLQVIKC